MSTTPENNKPELAGHDHVLHEVERGYDPLLDCLVELTRLHGRPSTHAALSAGLPLRSKGLVPSLFARAAARAGFASKVVRRPLAKINGSLLPVILLLQDNEACVLVERSIDSSTVKVLFPESGQGAVELPVEEIEVRYTGVAIFARPQFRFDSRSPELVPTAQKHWFWSVFYEQLPMYRDVLVGAALINIFALALPFFTMNVYDRIVPNHAEETLWMLSLGLVLVLVMDYVLKLVRSHLVDLAGSRIDLKLSSRIMERVLGMRLAERPPSVGSYAQTLRSFESIRDFVASATVTSLIDLPFALLFILLIGWVCWPLVFLPMLGIVAILIFSQVRRKQMVALAETTYRASAMRNSILVESLTALETIKSNNAEGATQKRWEESAAFLSRVSAQMRLVSSSVVNGVGTIQQVVNLLIVVAGVYLIDAHMLTVGGLIASTMLASRCMAPLGQVAGLMMQYENAKMALTSLETEMGKPVERPEGSAFVHRPVVYGEIEFHHVTFGYSEQMKPALEDVSFRIKPGEHVVILGRTGSGKTTLQKLMLGLYHPSEGAVRVDGVDLRQLDPADLRRNIGYVEQQTMLFYGTLRQNLTIGAPYADDGRIIAAAETAMLGEFVNRHPQGFDMLIGERGETLSGGQRQGVAIARAVLMEPPILLMDEPTSATDASTEARLIEKLRAFARGRTMVIVTHRTSLLELADRVIVLDEGKVVADGARDKVLDDLRAGRVGRAV